MTITQFGILSVYCTHELYQMFGNAPKFAQDVKQPRYCRRCCYMCGQQLQHREARGKTKGQSYTSNKITIGLNRTAHHDKILFSKANA